MANRVSEIQTTLPEAQWHHVASQDNPADCASRGMSPIELAHHGLWWRGPAWLTSRSEPWVTAVAPPDECEIPEQETKVHARNTHYHVQELHTHGSCCRFMPFQDTPRRCATNPWAD